MNEPADEPTNELARLRAKLRLTEQWLEEARRDLAAAHEQIGELRAENDRLAHLAMERGARR